MQNTEPKPVVGYRNATASMPSNVVASVQLYLSQLHTAPHWFRASRQNPGPSPSPSSTPNQRNSYLSQLDITPPWFRASNSSASSSPMPMPSPSQSNTYLSQHDTTPQWFQGSSPSQSQIKLYLSQLQIATHWSRANCSPIPSQRK